MRRTSVLLDAMVRAGLVWLLVVGIWRLARTCPPQESCDDPGLGTIVVVPFAVYLAWNVVGIVVDLLVVLPSKRPWASGVVALVAIPRLAVLAALTTTGRGSWPFVVLFVVTVVAQALAFVAFVRGSDRSEPPNVRGASEGR